MRNHPLGREATIIGAVQAEPAGMVFLRTDIGGMRVLDMGSGTGRFSVRLAEWLEASVVAVVRASVSLALSVAPALLVGLAFRWATLRFAPRAAEPARAAAAGVFPLWALLGVVAAAVLSDRASGSPAWTRTATFNRASR